MISAQSNVSQANSSAQLEIDFKSLLVLLVAVVDYIIRLTYLHVESRWVHMYASASVALRSCSPPSSINHRLFV